MSRNGSGTYSLPAGNPVVTGTTISSSWANTTLSDIASALTGSVASDGQTPMTGNLQMGSNKITGLAAGTASTDAANYGQITGGTEAGVFTNVTDSALTSGRVVYASTGGLLADSANLTFNGTTLTANALTVTGATALNGGATLGDASGDALTINSSAVSIPNGLNFDSNTLVIDATNNRVGVGTASPNRQLGLTGSTEINSSSTVYHYFGPNGTDLQGFIGYNSNGNTDIGARTGYGITFNTKQSGAVAEVMRITSAGNVGIGTSSPDGILHTSKTNGVNIFESAGVSSVGLQFRTNGTDRWRIQVPSASADLAFYTGSATTERMRIDSSGNLGLGVTPSAWGGGKAIQLTGGYVQGFSSTEFDIGSNVYFSGSNHIYSANGLAAIYRQNSGTHKFFTAPSGTAGGVATFTQAMTLDASGRLGIGTTSPGTKLEVSESTGAEIGVRVTGTTGATFTKYANTGQNFWVGLDNSTGSAFVGSAYSANLYTSGAYPIIFSNSATERMRIDSSGIVSVRTTATVADTNVPLQLNAASAAQTFIGVNRGGGYGLLIGYDYINDTARVRNIANTAMTFETNNTERMRIDSSGNLLINSTTNANSIKCKIKAGQGDQLELDNSGNQFTSLYYSNNGTIKVSTYWDNTNARFYVIPVSAGVYLASGGTSWTSNSDERKKDIIEPITNAINKVSTLRTVIGKYKSDAEGTRRPFLIAQDVQAVLPEAVESSNPDDLGVNYTEVIPLLVAAIKEIKAEFDAYKATHP